MKGFFENQEEDINPLERKYHKSEKFQVFEPRKKEGDYESPELQPVTPCQCQMENSDMVFCNRHQCIKTKSLIIYVRPEWIILKCGKKERGRCKMPSAQWDCKQKGKE